MNDFIIKSISLSQKKVKNIDIKEIPLWTVNKSTQYAVKFEYNNTELFLTYAHREWKGKLVGQIVKEIENKIKEYEKEKEDITQAKQVIRVLFALEIKLKMRLGKDKYDKINQNKNMEEKTKFVNDRIKAYKRKRGSSSHFKEVYSYCMDKLYEELVKELEYKNKQEA